MQKHKGKQFRLVMKKSNRTAAIPAGARRVGRAVLAKPIMSARTVARALAKTSGAKELTVRYPSLRTWSLWSPVASFSPCQKTGTARYLDIWDADHFDGFTDMQKNLSDCRVWFADRGYTTWDSPQTRTGRMNCYFTAPTAGEYVCNVQLQSHAGAAEVECLIDSSSFGPLPVNGSITQPHTTILSAGGHSFRIRQRSGAYFFIALTVWKT